MPIESKCPGCGRTLRVPTQYAGQSASCPVCFTVYTVPSAEPSALEPATAAAPDASDRWVLRIPEGQTYGPVSRQVLDTWVQEGRVSDDCQVLHEEDGVWRDAVHFYPDLAPIPLASAAPFDGAPTGIAALDGSSPFPATATTRVVNPHRGGLVLTIGILSWALGCTVLGVMAWIMGSNDLREMRHGSMDTQGMGLTQAGQLIGMIHVILSVVALLIGLVTVISLGILS